MFYCFIFNYENLSVLLKSEADLLENSESDVDYEFDECGIKIEAPDDCNMLLGKK